MPGVSPNHEDWQKLSAVEIWEAAVLIHGFDPRAFAEGEVVVQDANNPSNPIGIVPDISWEIRALISAVLTGDLTSAPLNITDPNEHSKVTIKSLLTWLRQHGYGAVANNLGSVPELNEPSSQAADASIEPALSDPERRLSALRELGGDAKWLKMKWRFTKIKMLVAQEKRTQKTRSDEKTIRKDLIEAVDAERMAESNRTRP